MAIVKTVNFLPEIFRTETNKKFLNATLDQLVTEPNFTKVNGYIGRKFSPTHNTNDNYIVEPSTSRQNYQLEPAVVITDKQTDTVDFFSSYLDLLQQIQYNGGIIDNHNRLFSNESYSYDGMFDYDKFTNFKNYYWVPNGPASVDVFAGNVETEEDYDVTRNLSVAGFNFSERGIESNPVLVLARGGTYTFKVDDVGHKFWIQTEPGVTGRRLNQTNISTREIFGVTNNGTDDGTLTFKVPLADAQNRFTLMPTIETVDMASSLHYSKIQGNLLSTFLATNPTGIDGQTTYADLQNKSLVFITNDDVVTDLPWTNNEFFDMLNFGIVPTVQVVPNTDRRNVWRINILPIGEIDQTTGVADDYIINLVPSTVVTFDQKVYIKNGIVSGTKEYHLDFDHTYHQVPVITSILDRLYYQDSTSSTFFGEIRIVDAENFTIDVDKDIIGQISYASPNGVDFTNGLKISFNSTVSPVDYANSEYYVEGVGTGIRLVAVTDLVTTEAYAENGLTTPDYISINRGSIDLNGWSRSNRWFHIDVLTQTANLNKEVLIYTFTYDPNFNNEFIAIPDNVNIVTTIRSKVAIQNLAYEYTNGQIFYAYGEDNFYQLGADLITLTDVNNYRAKNTSLPDQEFRAKRPIVEFEHSLKLYNFGIDAIEPVDYLDFTVTDAFSDIERSGSIYSDIKNYVKNSVVINGTNVYGAIKNTQTLPTDSVVWKERFPLVPFDASRTYTKGERISSGGFAYEALKNVAINDIPTDDNKDITWFQLFPFTVYNSATANTIVKGGVVNYNSIAYEANEDIAQSPTATNSTSWELLFSLSNNKTIIFANELDPEVRKQVYTISLVTIAGTPTIHLTQKTKTPLENGDVVVVLAGKNAKKNYWFDGSLWFAGQLKSKINESPMFDVFDGNDISFGDATTYPNSTFTGTTIFQYKKSTGTANDEVLGFPVSYRNFNSISDLEFETTFNSDTLSSTVLLDTVVRNINTGFLVKNYTKTLKEYRNTWVKNTELSKQYQILTFEFDGATNYFEIDLLSDEVKTTPNLKVWVKNKLLKRGSFTLELIGTKLCVVIDPQYLINEFDKVDILLYSRKGISEKGYYEVPSNLDFNAENVDFTSLTLGQLKDHIAKLEENTNVIYEASGTFTSQRDLYYKNSSGTILQHGFPLLYSNLFLTNDNTNFVESIELASREYTKFKNKFLELGGQISTVDSKTTEQHVDTIIEAINLTKDSTFPFYNSDMLPFGNNRTVYNDTVINPNLKQFDLPAVFNDNILGNTATLVYVNDVQLTKGKDYYFPQDRSAIIVNSTYTLTVDDKIRVVVYNNTDGSYLPATPSKLGLYPKYQPEKYFDETFRTPINVIQGHDGSVIPAFNDFRDDLLLEFERRIYNNIKINYDENIFDIHEYIPGYFRDSDYTEIEWKRIVSRSFLKWAGANQVDYSTNKTFKSSDPWTWNFSGQISNLDSKVLTGSSRAIYLSMFDTTRPHTHPWEMLGFAIKPLWWEARYGTAPYTGGNTLLWEDLELGYIHSGTRQGYNDNFKRTGLTSMIPVDEYGVLKSPDQFIVRALDPTKVNQSFSVGAVSPAEYSWIKSSDYPFAVQRGLALIKPAFYFGSLLNIKRYYRDTKLKQLVNMQSLKRISPNTVVIPDSMTTATASTPSTRNFVAGYLNWVVDYMTYRGIDPQTTLAGYFKNIEVQLAYKSAGYTGKNYINVLAEQSSPTSKNESIMVPDENYKIILNKSTPIRKLVYSGVIVERSGNGFTITGYDLSNPYFSIIPSVADNENHTLSVLDRRAVIYHNYQRKKILIPYGHEFSNVQQICDFLISYGRYLVGQGFTFNHYDAALGEQRNWELSCKEFLAWEQQEWDDGSLVVLSPTYDRIDLNVAGGTVDYVSNETNGNKVLNQNYGVIKNTEFTVSRQPNEFSLETLNNNTICLFEGRVVQWEHVLVFDNTTVFNDIIYLPALGNRQFRLKVIGNKTADWNGELSPAGFVYNDPKIDAWVSNTDYKKGSLVTSKGNYYVALTNAIGTAAFDLSKWSQIDRFAIKTGLLPNFAFNAQKFVNLYDIENMPIDETLQEFSSGLIGLRNRKYLSDLNLDFQSQTKFYQGFIKEKGTANSVTALTSATFNNISSKIKTYEEWAVRVGEYGSLESDAQLEIELDDSKLTDNPSSLQLLNKTDANTPGVIGIQSNKLYKTTAATFNKNIFHARSDDSNYSNDISKAGFVNSADVDATLYDITNFNALNTYLKELGDGFKIWVAKDFSLNWNVYRLTVSDAGPVSLTFETDGIMSIQFNAPHNLKINDVFCIKGFDPAYDGFYKVKTTEDLQTILVDMYQGEQFLKEARSITNDTGMLFEMDSMRIADPMLLNSIAPKRGWKNGDNVWVESFDLTNRWGVYQKENTWTNSQEIGSQSSEYIGADGYGSNVKINSNGDLIVVGAGDSGAGRIAVHSLLPEGTFAQTGKFIPTQHSGTVTGYGDAIDVSDYITVVGAPRTNPGTVFVHNFRISATDHATQIIQAPTTSEGFGKSVRISDNNKWLFVGAPDANKVYVYHRDNSVINQSKSITLTTTPIRSNTDGSTLAEYNLGFTPVAPSALVVYLNNPSETLLTYNVDYTISGTTLTLLQTHVDAITTALGNNDNHFLSVATGVNRNYELGWTVTDSSSVVVKINDNDILTEGLDYTISGTTLTVIPDLTSLVTALTITQARHWKYENVLTPPGSVNSDAEFGRFLYCDNDGTELFVGAPSETVNSLTNVGKVYHYIRHTEFQKSNPQTTAYRPSSDITSVADSVVDVFVGDTELIVGVDYTYNVGGTNEVILTTAIDAGQKIKIASNIWHSMQEILAPSDEVIANTLFGSQIAVDFSSASIYITAPGYKTNTYDSGKVYRYIKPSRHLGKVTGTVADPVLTVGDNLYINGFIVALDSTTVESLSTKINGSNIPGITSSVVAGKLTITSSSKLTRNKLFLACANNSTLCADLGIGDFEYSQTIEAPGGGVSETFGLSVSVGDNDETLLIGSGNALTIQALLIDKLATASTSTTTFDGSSTLFIDKVFGSNAYIYELFENDQTNLTNTGQHIFAQKFDLIANRRFDFFGLALDLKKEYIIVGDPGDDQIAPNGGTAWLYKTGGKRIWSRTREQGTEVDIDTLSRMLIYSKKSNNILSNFDYIDPAKGKILGQAEINLDFKTATDPAFYTNNPASNVEIQVDANLHWGADQVGMTWWDLSLVRYIDYEQDSLTYRIKNWGKMFPGSSVSVSEWIESTVPPSGYTLTLDADGVPKYTADGTYVQTTVVDESTGIVKEKYYYWVTKKNSAINKTRSIVSITEMIENPELQGIPYAALVAENAVSLYNVNDYLNGTDVVLQIRYDLIRNNNSVHTEYELIQEGNPDSNIPTSIINKLIDSLAGEDSSGFVVPDPSLLTQDKYGISVRPRQTMIRDRQQALKNFVGTVNDVLIQHPIRQQKILTKFLSHEKIPATTEYDFAVDLYDELAYLDVASLATGYKVFVSVDSTIENRWSIYTLNASNKFILTRVQAFNTEFYWDYTDWYATGYNSTTKEDYTVDYEKDVKSLSLLPAGSIIRVRYNNIGTFTLYKTQNYNDIDNLTLIGLGNGTVKLSDRLYDSGKYTLGFATENFDSQRFDINPSVEIRNIFNALQHDVYTGTLRNEFNKLFFTLVYYILQSERNADWIFKTSFITVLHQLRELTQYPSYVKDNQDYYIDYINEVKPYRSKIREYLISYAGNDTYQGNVSDFDLPAYYEDTINSFRSPTGEGINDDTLLEQRQYQDWVKNKALTLESIQVAQGGTGYTLPPVVTVKDGVTGALSLIKPIAKINPSTGKVTSITFSGSYTFNSTPTIVINGNGTGAKAYPVMVNDKIRGIRTTIKFDRNTYRSNLVKWTAMMVVKENDYVYYQNEIYQATQDLSASSIFDFRYFTQLSHDYGNALDRIVAYYVNADGVAGADLLTNLISGINYPGVRVTGLTFEDDASATSYIDTYMQSTYLDTTLGTRAEDITVDGGAFVDKYSSHAPEELVPGINFDTLVLSVFTRITDNNGEIVSGPPLGFRIIQDLTQSQERCPTTWSATTYNKGDYVLHSGSYYVALENVNLELSTTPDSSATRWRFVWKTPTAWDGALDYDKSAYVTHAGLTYASNHKIDYKGTVATTADLVVSASNINFDLYYVTSESSYYYWNETDNSWQHATAGTWTGKISYSRGDWVLYSGVLYNAKRGFNYKTEVALIANLPAMGQLVSDVHYVTNEASYYYWNGNSWIAAGPTPNAQGAFWLPRTDITETLGSTPLSMPIIWQKVNASTYDATLDCPVKFSPNDSRKYYRISASRSTLLTQAFASTDTVMHLEDVGKVPDPDAGSGIPGVIYVQGEIIYYYEKDQTNNTLGRIRRGVLGTGMSTTIPVGTRADDLGKLQELSENSDYTDWMNSLGEFGFVEVGDYDYQGAGFGYAYNVAYPDSPNDADSDAGDAPFDYNISISSGGAATEQATFLSKASAYNP
jgi:hypothetical protein